MSLLPSPSLSPSLLLSFPFTLSVSLCLFLSLSVCLSLSLSHPNPQICILKKVLLSASKSIGSLVHPLLRKSSIPNILGVVP